MKSNWVWFSFIGVLIVWIGYAYLILPANTHFFKYRQFASWTDAGVFGDSFGALTCLFSALAFGGVLFSMFRDHQEKRQEAEVRAFTALHDQMDRAIQSTNEPQLKKDFEARKTYYANRINKILTVSLMSDEVIVQAFSSLGGFPRDEITKRVDDLRVRLLGNFVDSSNKLFSMLSDVEIRNFLKEAYNRHFDRSPDADGFAIWGSHLYITSKSASAKAAIDAELAKIANQNTQNPTIT